MNDYISKPVDERLLYGKIIDLLKKDNPVNGYSSRSKCIDLTYLTNRTKANPELLMDMITLYLDQTPPLISTMKQSLHDKDWDSLYTAVHKMIPSFYIMGIHQEFENMGKKVQEYAGTQQHLDELQDLVLQLENICTPCLQRT